MGTWGTSPPAPVGGNSRVMGGEIGLAMAEEHIDMKYLVPWVTEQLMEGLFSKIIVL